MISINTNYGSLYAAKAAQDSQRVIDNAMTKLSTGKRINASKDDSAGQAIAMRLEGEIRGLAIASRNASDGQALIDTADGALKETHSILVRMRELAVQAQNGTLQDADKTALGVEFDALEAEITRISDNTSEYLKGIPDDLEPILYEIGNTYLPYLSANVEAVKKQKKFFDFKSEGMHFKNARYSQYRVWCLNEIQNLYRQLPDKPKNCLLYTSPSPRDQRGSRMPACA